MPTIWTFLDLLRMWHVKIEAWILEQAGIEQPKEEQAGLRLIYFWWEAGRQFWLFTLYDKSEMDDLSAKEKGLLKDMLKRELDARR